MDIQLDVVIAPDSFKGSLNAVQVAEAMAVGVRRALGDAAKIHMVPMADGGEGTLDALLRARGGREMLVDVCDALGRPRVARYGILPDTNSAIIEAAEANGLPHVSDEPLKPLEADSYGVGQLAVTALEAGVTEILLCIGGSATSDGGVGVLRALGARFLDAAGRPTRPGGGGLKQIHRLDLDSLHPAAREARWLIAVDVDNPLVGDRGAAAVFGPQKGANPHDIIALDEGLTHLASKLSAATGCDEAWLLHSPGMGAAGGLPASLSAVLGARILTGVQLVSDAVKLGEVLQSADIVITGEGSFDKQSLHGKVVDGVRAAKSPSSAAVVIAGRVELTAQEVADAGFAAALSIAQGPASEQDLMTSTADLVTDAAQYVCSLLGHRWFHTTQLDVRDRTSVAEAHTLRIGMSNLERH